MRVIAYRVALLALACDGVGLLADAPALVWTAAAIGSVSIAAFIYSIWGRP